MANLTSTKDSSDMLTSTTVFLVGQAEEIMVQNTFILSKASPIFEAMLYGELQEKGQIKIPDIEPDAFEILLKFANGEGITFYNMDHAARVCYAADKYDLPALKRHCAEYIYPSSVDEMWFALECGILFNIDFLKEGAMKLLRQKTYEVLSSQHFVSLSKNALKMILEEDNLNIDSEVELFNAVLYWTKHQCSMEGKLFSQKNLRDAMGEMIHHIRFLTMTQTEIIKCGRLVFTADEMKILLSYLSKENDQQLADFLCSSSEKRKKPRACISMNHVIHSVRFTKVCKKCITPSNKISTQLLYLPPPKTSPYSSSALYLYSVTIPTRSHFYEMYNRLYFEEVTVTIKKSTEIIASGEFTGKVSYDTELQIPLFTSDGRKPHLSSAYYYDLSLAFKAKDIHYYPLGIYSGTSIFSGLDNTPTFLIGFEYSN